MKRNVMLMVVGLTLAVLLAGTGWASSTAATEEIQLTGTVLKGGRLVDDQGQEYQMAKDEGGSWNWRAKSVRKSKSRAPSWKTMTERK